MLSRSRARAPIYAFSPDAEVARRLALWWGITPVQQPLADGLESNIAVMERYLLERCSATEGDTVVIAGSHPFEPGVHTNFVKYHVLDRRG
jgi:pyruvate kinase